MICLRYLPSKSNFSFCLRYLPSLYKVTNSKINAHWYRLDYKCYRVTNAIMKFHGGIYPGNTNTDTLLTNTSHSVVKTLASRATATTLIVFFCFIKFPKYKFTAKLLDISNQQTKIIRNTQKHKELD